MVATSSGRTKQLPVRFRNEESDESDDGYKCEMKYMALSNIAIQYHVFVTTSC